ncbi:MAG: hypothetical protein IT335_13745 [Thermomicrobiales bacterium]|nr:hypothetical protein [Thermomicrobiales bacterium]
MNRRLFLAGSAAAMLPAGTAAHEPPELLNRFLAMMESQNWADADQILAVNYAPLYPLSTSQWGREAFKQRMAASQLNARLAGRKVVLIAYNGTDEMLLFLAEYRDETTGAALPYYGVLALANGLITGIETSVPLDLLAEQEA